MLRLASRRLLRGRSRKEARFAMTADEIRAQAQAHVDAAHDRGDHGQAATLLLLAEIAAQLSDVRSQLQTLNGFIEGIPWSRL
jgi:Tfp pilus assembly protein PilF